MAQRASNTGRKVIVATSDDPSDDGLARLLTQNRIEVFRGSLSSPLSRVISCLEAYPDQTVVHRLTADNVFPDGAFLDELEQYFVEKGLSYLCCNGERSGLPYGMSAELMWLKDLRTEHNNNNTFDHEHVTPAIRRRFGDHYFAGYRSLAMGGLRCTVDNLDDYLSVLKVFVGLDDAVNTPWIDLCNRLKVQTGEPQRTLTEPIKGMVLGTVQLGIPYGINNHHGQPSQSDAINIIRTAIQCGTEYLDTARAYGCSEDVIGLALSAGWQGRAKVITKLSPLSNLGTQPDHSAIEYAVRASVFESCTRLRTQQLDVLLLHRAEHLTLWQGQIWHTLLQLQQENVIKDLGVSVHTPEELGTALTFPQVSFIQLPFNILDWRWDAQRDAIERARTNGVTFHARSTLLQGLLASTDPSNWAQARVKNHKPVLDWLTDSAIKNGRQNVIDLCISYVRGHTWISGLCIGMETLEQLVANTLLFQQPALTEQQIAALESSRPKLSEESLNPSLWCKD